MSEQITSFFELIADATGFDAGFSEAEKKAVSFAAEFKAVSLSVSADADKMGASIERSIAVGSLSRGQAAQLIGQRLAFYGASAEQAGLSQANAAKAAAGAAAGAGGVEMGSLMAGLAVPVAVLGGLGLLTAALASAEEGIAQETSAILRNSEAIGINAQDLQTWQKIAAIVGIDQQSMVMDFERFSKQLAEGAPALKAHGITLQQLGITSTDVGQSILRLADYFHTHSDQAQKSKIASDLFGRSGAELIPILDQGSAAFKNYRGELEKMGVLFSNSDLIAGAQAQTAIQQFSNAVEGAKDRLLTAALPGFTMFFEDVSQILASNGQVWTEIGTIIGTVVSYILGIIAGLTHSSIDFASPPKSGSAAYDGLKNSATGASSAITNAGAATKAATQLIDDQIAALQEQKRAQDELYSAQKQALQDQLDKLHDVTDTRRRQGEDIISYERRLEELGIQDKIKAIDKTKTAYDHQVDDHIAALQRERKEVAEAATGMGNDLAAGMAGGTKSMLDNVSTTATKINQKFVDLGKQVGITIGDWFTNPTQALKDAEKLLGEAVGQAVVDGIEHAISNQLGSMFSVPNGPHWSGNPKAGGHARGTISTTEHLAWISEGNSKEAVLPLNDPSRSLALMEQSGLASLARGAGAHSGSAPPVIVNFNGPVADELVAGRVMARIDKEMRERGFSQSRGFGTS